ncbi:MAG: hypothetical protein GY854_11500 [Deltaproteobacteria bacterium]|nr:hypothetical protein [Deltaproteobacteria bacterium]
MGRIIQKSMYASMFLQLIILLVIKMIVAPKHYPRGEIVEDIDFAITTMESVHPNLYSQIPKERVVSFTSSIKKQLSARVSDITAFKHFREITALFKDGHTKGGLSYLIGFMLFSKMPPYKFKVINDRLFVAKNYSYRGAIPVGSEILEIDGEPAHKCIEEVGHLLSYETKDFRNARLAQNLWWGLWKEFGDFEIKYQTSDNDMATLRSRGGVIASILAILDWPFMRTNYSFKTIENDVGYLEFNKFSGLEAFEVFLEDVFSQIKNKNIGHLIIDIRANGGGNSSLGKELMQYISPGKFKTFDAIKVKVSEELLKRNTESDYKNKPPGSIVDYKQSLLQHELRDNPLRYSGKSYLLISGNTFSSAAQFAAMFKCYKVGKIVGVETGGITVTYGDTYRYELPNTKFSLRVSYKKFHSPCARDDRRGVVPDYIIEDSIEDIIEGKDRVLDFTFGLIKNKGTPN